MPLLKIPDKAINGYKTLGAITLMAVRRLYGSPLLPLSQRALAAVV